eukprot:4463298-Pyramimonas_sp.AAC.1
MPGLHTALLNTPGRGRCSHGRGGHRALLGYDRKSRAWRTAQKKKTYPTELCRCIADCIATTISAMFDDGSGSHDDELPCDMCDEEATRQELLQFWVAWDPHAGTEESWAPDFAPRAQRRARPDPEWRGSCPRLQHRRQRRNRSLPSPHWLRKRRQRRREVRQPGARRNMLSRG